MSARQPAVDDAPDLRQLVHQVDFRVESAGGVRDHEVGAARDGGVQCVVDDRTGVGARGVRLAVITAAGELAHVPSRRVRVVDTIGAGDTVQGALLAWLHARKVTDLGALAADGWTEALGFAAKAASITVSRSGAEPPTAQDMASAV